MAPNEYFMMIRMYCIFRYIDMMMEHSVLPQRIQLMRSIHWITVQRRFWLRERKKRKYNLEQTPR